MANNMYDRNTFLWGPEHGDPIYVKDIPLDHFVNILNWIDKYYLQYGADVQDFFLEEAEYRRITSFAKGEAYPLEVNGEHIIVEPK